MGDSKSINIVLLDGDMDGIVNITDNTGNVSLLLAPRDDALRLLSEVDECKQFGAYLLLAPNRVYVGQTSNLSNRIKNHLKNKKWWKRVVILTTSGNKLNTAHTLYIEDALIKMAKENDMLDSENKRSGDKTNLSISDQVIADNFIKDSLFLLELINVNVFREKTNSSGLTILDRTNVVYDKTSAKEYLTKIGKTPSKEFSYAKLGRNDKNYAIDVNNSLLENDWEIVLNNVKTLELIIIKVPKEKIEKFGISNFIKKNSDHKSIRIDKTTLVDTSSFDFAPFIVEKISYLKDTDSV